MHDPGPSYRPARHRLTDAALWRRGAVMLVLLVLVMLARWVILVVAVGQFLWVLVTGRRNEDLARFGADLGRWLAAATGFLAFADDNAPFPWSRWGR
jgi:hypothetical protein